MDFKQYFKIPVYIKEIRQPTSDNLSRSYFGNRLEPVFDARFYEGVPFKIAATADGLKLIDYVKV